MAATDIAPIANRLVALIAAVPDMGNVSAVDLYSRDDVTDALVSFIDPDDPEPTTRAWWLSGPGLVQASYVTQSFPANAIERAWDWRIRGVEGLDAANATATTKMRDLMLGVMDALDADRTMGGTAHRCEPCRVVEPPQLRIIGDRFLVVYVELGKVVTTLSAP